MKASAYDTSKHILSQRGLGWYAACFQHVNLETAEMYYFC